MSIHCKFNGNHNKKVPEKATIHSVASSLFCLTLLYCSLWVQGTPVYDEMISVLCKWIERAWAELLGWQIIHLYLKVNRSIWDESPCTTLACTYLWLPFYKRQFGRSWNWADLHGHTNSDCVRIDTSIWRMCEISSYPIYRYRFELIDGGLVLYDWTNKY